MKMEPLPDPETAYRSSDDRQGEHQVESTVNLGSLKDLCTCASSSRMLETRQDCSCKQGCLDVVSLVVLSCGMCKWTAAAWEWLVQLVQTCCWKLMQASWSLGQLSEALDKNQVAQLLETC